jgi:hypothetical protein
MNPSPFAAHRFIPLALALCVAALAPSSRAADADTSFPYAVPIELGTFKLADGDAINIVSVRGDRAQLEPGGTYLVEGTYTLASVPGADLALFLTSRGPSGPTPVSDAQHVQVTRGSGNFSLKETMPYDGWFHVSFYAPHEGHSHGGVYFGEKGVENTILRKTDWPDLSAKVPASVADAPATAASADAQSAILEYLGNPVPAPAGMDPKYDRDHLLAAFRDACSRQGLTVKALAVDTSEFPYVLYGQLEGKTSLRTLEPSLHNLSGYEYAGSVSGNTGMGGTYFALNMVPYSKYPADAAKFCSHRLTVRLQILADRALALE